MRVAKDIVFIILFDEMYLLYRCLRIKYSSKQCVEHHNIKYVLYLN